MLMYTVSVTAPTFELTQVNVLKLVFKVFLEQLQSYCHMLSTSVLSFETLRVRSVTIRSLPLCPCSLSSTYNASYPS